MSPDFFLRGGCILGLLRAPHLLRCHGILPQAAPPTFGYHELQTKARESGRGEQDGGEGDGKGRGRRGGGEGGGERQIENFSPPPLRGGDREDAVAFDIAVVFSRRLVANGIGVCTEILFPAIMSSRSHSSVG